MLQDNAQLPTTTPSSSAGTARKGALLAAIRSRKSLREAIGLDSDRVLGMALYARQLAEQGDLDSARELLGTLVAIDPDRAFLHSCLGAVAMQANDREQALASLSRAVELQSDDIAANTNLGELYLELGNFEAAAACLEQAVALDPEGKNPFANRARGLAQAVVKVAQEVEEKGPEALRAIQERVAEFQYRGES